MFHLAPFQPVPTILMTKTLQWFFHQIQNKLKFLIINYKVLHEISVCSLSDLIYTIPLPTAQSVLDSLAICSNHLLLHNKLSPSLEA